MKRRRGIYLVKVSENSAWEKAHWSGAVWRLAGTTAIFPNAWFFAINEDKLSYLDDNSELLNHLNKK
ncbi:MAG: hypothetical protein QNK20_01075 [Aureibaculum sp.]|nr:hypothetical protein [Aureibaculum sp.]